jgi:hypothetical protein
VQAKDCILASEKREGVVTLLFLKIGNVNGCQPVKESAHREHQISEDPCQSGGVFKKSNHFLSGMNCALLIPGDQIK